MTNIYELMFILRPDLSQDQVVNQMRKYRDLLKELGAGKVSIEVWGKRRLAYEVDRFQDGIYVLTYFNGDGSQVAPLEKNMRLSDEVIRYLTIKQNKDIEFEETELPDVQETVTPPAPVISSDSPEEQAPETEEVVDSQEEETTEPTEQEENVAVEA